MPAPEQITAEQRRARIAEVVEERGFAAVADLSETFAVSSVTVRSDLQVLAHRGVLRRIRGGALLSGRDVSPERPFEEAQVEAAAEKAAIAARAVDLVRSGMSVLLDVGTTAACVARELLRRTDLYDVTVITNGLSIALSLESAIPRLQVIVTGGTLRPMQHSLVAPLGGLVLDHVHADLAFIGCNGIELTAGITNINLPEAEIKRAMITAASTVVVVADGSKIGRAMLGKVCEVTDADVIVTGASASEHAVEGLVALGGPRILVAPPLQP